MHGITVCAKTKEEYERINASKRCCDAPYPVSNRLENPFKQRYCKQFDPDFRVKKGHFIDKKEAEKLNAMTPEELVKYWEENQ
jgi:hypothetical protein